jgi:hypothetical protein
VIKLTGAGCANVEVPLRGVPNMNIIPGAAGQ